MNTYIIKSFSHRLLKEEIKKITKDSTNIISYDIDENTINDVLEECNYYSLFNEPKFIIVRNMKYFSNKGEYKKENDQINNYLKQENKNTILIFIVNDLNNKNKNVKLIKEHNNLIIKDELNKDNLDKYIMDYLKKNNYKIDSKALELLEKKCINNLDIMLNELDKIFLIKKDYLITLEDIKEYCSTMLEENFDFINAVVENKKTMLLELDKLIQLKVEPTIILSQLVGQFKLMYTVVIGLSEMSEDTLANTLKIHPYRIKLAKEHGFNFGVSKIENILDKLNNLDLKIKGDYFNKYTLIKKFLLDILN